MTTFQESKNKFWSYSRHVRFIIFLWYDQVSYPTFKAYEQKWYRKQALRWFHEYHFGRTQTTAIQNVSPSFANIDLGANQGISLIGPEDYKIYTLPLGDIVSQHGLESYGYVIDT